MTTNKYWLFLENLRRSNSINMFGAAPVLAEYFEIDEKEAKKILLDWMQNYNLEDYK